MASTKKIIIPDLEKQYREAIRKNSDVSKTFVTNNFNYIRKAAPIAITGLARNKSFPEIGQMCFFYYPDPKTFKDLVFWDTFPCALIIDHQHNGNLLRNQFSLLSS